MAFIKDPLAVDRGFPSSLAQTQTNLFKNTFFEANDDDFQETPLLRKGKDNIYHVAIDKNIRTTLKAAKEDTSAPGPSNVAINEKTSMSAVNKDTSVQAVLPAPTLSTSCTSAPIKTSKKHQDKVDKTEALKKEKEKNKMTTNEQKQVRYPSCGGTDHSRSSRKLCPMNKPKTKLPKPKDTVEKTFNLFYNIFSIFAGQGKYASDSIKKSFKIFCESTSLTQSDLDKYASKGYMTIVSFMAKQYETLVRNYTSPYFCGDSLTVKQRKSLAKHIFEQKINLKSAWPSTKEMEQKKFIQEIKPQEKASSSYVHRKLQELSFVKKLNTSKHRSLKENILASINSNKTLEITSKLRNIDKKDIDAVQTLSKQYKQEFKTRPSCLKYNDSRGSRYFSLLPLYKIDYNSVQIDAQSFWKLAKQCGNKIKPGQKNDNDLTLWYFNVFDVSKIGYKTLKSLQSRPKKFANVITK
ncbi:hypothetical protein AB4K20DRAFT_1977567 [Rhizopus microsporus]